MPNLVFTIRKLCKPKPKHDDDDDDDCDDDLPQPPSDHHSFSPLKLLLICTLAAAISFLCYIIIIKTRRAFQTRRRRNQSHTHDQAHQDFVHEDRDQVFHPVWLINTVGLDQSVIDSIQVFTFRKGDHSLIDSDCPVCLGVFEDEESLRVLPKCNHAFHVGCIDTWLRSHTTCPVCRAPVVVVNQTLVESSTQEDENPTTGAPEVNGVRVQSDLTNRSYRKLEPIRRSVSMGSFRFADRELVASQKHERARRRGSSSSTVEEARALRSGHGLIRLEEI